MSLNAALNIAQNSLGHLSRQTATVARNVTDAGTPGYVRRDAVLSDQGVGSRVHVVRAQLDAQLVRAERDALSAGSAQTALATGLGALGRVLGSPEGEGSVHQAIGRLADGVQVWSSDPSNANLTATTLDAARGVAGTITEAARQIDALRTDTGSAIAADIANLNDLLAGFQQSNADVVAGVRRGEPDLDALDTRDGQLRDIARLMDVTTVPRNGGDLMVLTRDGTTLFETVPRQIGFAAASGNDPATVSVDGVPLRAGSGNGARGSISARMHMLNTVLPDVDARLNDVAQGLVNAFAETAPGLPDGDGLFTMPGGTAASFALSASHDPAVGGSMSQLRDGGANGVAYLANTSGGDGFSARLIAVADRTAAPLAQALDQTGWVDGLTADATREAASRDAVSTRITAQLQQQGGVDIDGELARLLELERGYEASARMMATADAMLATLLQAVR